MKKHASIDSKCICGQAVAFKIAKPKPFDVSISKASCACGSRYMLTCMLDKKTGEPVFDVEALELSVQAKECARSAVRERALG